MPATVPTRTIEQRRDWDQPVTPPRKRGETVVVDGFGVRVRVERGQLQVEDGAGRNRRTRRYSRATDKLARLVVLGGSGSLSLEALRWLNDAGAALVCIDRDGRLLATTAATRSEAKLRRAQALAPSNSSGLELAKQLLAAKLEGQQQVLDWLPANDYAHRVLRDSLTAVQAAETVQQAVAAEAEAAAAYWGCWSQVEVRFNPADRGRLPEHWQRFGTRTSPIGGGPRLAVTPAGAVLNYLYALLEAEARLACQVVGLDPALAVIHADIRGRDSLPLDLMEAVRPNVDRYLLALLRDQTFRAADFHQTRRGSCRLLAPLTHQLAETLPAWRQLVAPATEQAATLLLAAAGGAAGQQTTPLTQRKRRADRARRAGRPTTPPPDPHPAKPGRTCRRCGGRLPHPGRVYCDDCLPWFQQDRYKAFIAAGQTVAQQRRTGHDPSHGGTAAERRGASQTKRQHELREWTTANGGRFADPAVFGREILPLLKQMPLSILARETGLTRGYLGQIRRGVKTPHPRHWDALRRSASTST